STATLFPYTTLFRSAMTTMAHPFTVNRSTIIRAAKHIMLNFYITVQSLLLLTYIRRSDLETGLLRFCFTPDFYCNLINPTNMNRSEEHTSELQSREN